MLAFKILRNALRKFTQCISYLQINIIQMKEISNTGVNIDE